MVLKSRMCGRRGSRSWGFAHSLKPRLLFFDPFQGLDIWQVSGLAVGIMEFKTLAALGELSAAYQMIPQMRVQPSRMLKQVMAVGDLRGGGKEFYQVLIAEMETPTPGASDTRVWQSEKGRAMLPG